MTARTTLPLLGLLALLVDCRCWEHPLYDEGTNRFDTWYLGGGNTQNRPFRRGDVDGVLDIELALDRDRDGDPIVRALVIDAIDPLLVHGDISIDGQRLAAFVAIDGEQLVAHLPPLRGAAPSLLARFHDGHDTRLEIVIPAPELHDALAAVQEGDAQ